MLIGKGVKGLLVDGNRVGEAHHFNRIGIWFKQQVKEPSVQIPVTFLKDHKLPMVLFPHPEKLFLLLWGQVQRFLQK